ncbi:MAG: type I restriction endonuclease [Bacteroidetes bacterium 4572_77]|nr:MAG: type I restriction endonuclease [Bacteroidetes bacterium 4572_77]
MKFTEEKLEQAFIQLISEQDIPHVLGTDIERKAEDVLIEDDLRNFLMQQYKSAGITDSEVEQIIRKLKTYSSSDLYESNKSIMKLLGDGFVFKREDPKAKDLWIYLIDYPTKQFHAQAVQNEELNIAADPGVSYQLNTDNNIYKIVNQLEIEGYEKRIPDAILYVNGLPLVVIEFKSAIRENATIHNAYIQLTVRYQRDIPELFKYNAFCVISDGVNNKAGSFFAPYDFYYAWRSEPDRHKTKEEGFNTMYSLIEGMLNRSTLRDIIRNFIYIPDSSKKDEKIVCRYPQYYAAKKLYNSIKIHQRPQGDGKGGTYFGATGSGKSFTMLYLTRLLMKSVEFSSPTIVLITDRIDLDVQLSKTFTNAKGFIGDNTVVSVESRNKLREFLQGRNSGGVFLTTIHKFTEDTELLTKRSNVICISDEAHRSQINLDQKIRVDQEKGTVTKTYGFAKYLHDSLPNATYVGFTGTPIDATLDVFGEITDSYTMSESVKDEITKKIVYEGRAAKVLLNNTKLKEIEAYYAKCEEQGANEHQIEESKKATAQMNAIIGDPDRLKAVAEDFIEHYETRVNEGASVKGKAMFVCSSRPIAYELYKEIIALRPKWKVKTIHESSLSEREKKEILPIERIKMIMTRGKDDEKLFFEMLGTKEDRKKLDTQFKNEKSNFKIAIVVDMWLTGFDVPFLDTMYIDKPVQLHSLIQTISRVNRNYPGKDKGLIVDYIGIKSQMNKALKKYSKSDKTNFEDIQQSIATVKDQLDLLSRIFHKFDTSGYFSDDPVQQLQCLNQAAEYVQLTKDLENRFMNIMKRLKTAYDICCGSEEFSQEERDLVHFYLAIRSIVFKLTKGDAPDSAQMNAKVREMIKEAIQSEGVEEIYKLGDENESKIDIFDEDYLAKIDKIKLPNTKIKILQKLLAKAIEEFKKVNKAKGVDFSKKMNKLVESYNERKADVLQSEVLEDFTDEIIDLYHELKKEKESFGEMGIDFEEKAFYDILKMIAHKFDFEYPDDKCINLAKEVKLVVDDKAKYVDWNHRSDIKAELKMDLIKLLAKFGYPPITKDEVYKEILEQAENFKKYQK